MTTLIAYHGLRTQDIRHLQLTDVDGPRLRIGKPPPSIARQESRGTRPGGRPPLRSCMQSRTKTLRPVKGRTHARGGRFRWNLPRRRMRPLAPAMPPRASRRRPIR
jgi:hypothetical protein